MLHDHTCQSPYLSPQKILSLQGHKTPLHFGGLFDVPFRFFQHPELIFQGIFALTRSLRGGQGGEVFAYFFVNFPHADVVFTKTEIQRNL